MLTLTLIQKIAVWAIPLLLAITMHESAHAWVASLCGDTTAKMLGRLSINPMHHIDLVGTILVPILLAVLTQFQFIFGWAKPVPINWMHLRKPRRDMALVAAAGPLSNILMALLWAAILKIALMFHPQAYNLSYFLVLTGQAGILINLVLAFLNLIPLPPLDGSRILASFLSHTQAELYLRLERFGFLILLILIITGALSHVLLPPLYWSLQAIDKLFNLGIYQ